METELLTQIAEAEQANQQVERIANLERDIEDIRHILQKKTGQGSADIKSNQIAGTISGTNTVPTLAIQALAVTTAKINTAAVTSGKISYEVLTVTITAGNSSSTATAVTGDVIVGFYPDTNCDQIVKNVSISGTTVTVNLLANSTGTSTIKVFLLKLA